MEAEPQWARIQVHNVYEYFTESFESLRENEVRWTPYTNEEANLRAPNGVSILCYRDEAYWMTRKILVYDIFVEGYNVQRLMHQMGLYQQVPVPTGLHLLPDMHTQKRQANNRYRRSMHLRMTPWIEAWSQALNDVVHETRAYDHNTYEQYMACRSTSVHEAPTISTIPEITQMSERLGGFGPTQEGTRMVRPVPRMPHASPHMIPQMTPDVPTSHWQWGFAPFAGTSQGIPTIPRVEVEFVGQGGFTSLGGSFRPELMAGFRPYTASYGDMSSFGGGSSSVPNKLRASQTDDVPQMTQPTQPDDGDLQGNNNDPRRSNREHHEPNRLSLSGPRHAAGRRKKTTSKRADTSRTMTNHDDE
uniref:Aminotransferase-like plant mobile domain-containing protein n=1 Tax=Oryza punctata TaxID=4537 RepID=A0A0E0M6K5_ORYPU